jgi:hypothetical protein
MDTNMTHHYAYFLAVLGRLPLLVLVCPVLCHASDGVAPQPQRIANVQAGRVSTARASWWGFDPADATRSLQAALNSRAREIIIDVSIQTLGIPAVFAVAMDDTFAFPAAE